MNKIEEKNDGKTPIQTLRIVEIKNEKKLMAQSFVILKQNRKT